MWFIYHCLERNTTKTDNQTHQVVRVISAFRSHLGVLSKPLSFVNLFIVLGASSLSQLTRNCKARLHLSYPQDGQITQANTKPMAKFVSRARNLSCPRTSRAKSKKVPSRSFSQVYATQKLSLGLLEFNTMAFFLLMYQRMSGCPRGPST